MIWSCKPDPAERPQVAVGTVKSRASRAHKRLADLMGLKDSENAFSAHDPAGISARLKRSVGSDAALKVTNSTRPLDT